MMNLKIIGCGAAGNKAATKLIEEGYNPKDVTLINSTIKDIPSTFNCNSIIFGDNTEALGGCGKERDLGKKLILQDLKTGIINLDNIVDKNTNAVVIVSSTEGGTGSAITPIVAKYLREIINIPVIVCLFFGFNTDVRGMQNSIELCQELEDEYGIIAISNAKFLSKADLNIKKAENFANNKFVEIVDTISGKNIIPGEQNIDDTDLYKLIVTEGYMMVESVDIAKVKNVDQYNKSITSAIDDSYLIDSNSGCKRIGVIYDTPETIHGNIDFSSTKLSNIYGTPYEMFTHIQNTDNPGKVSWIVTGMNMPMNEIKEIYEKYLEASNSVNKKKDEFFQSISEFKGNSEDGMFNILSTKKTGKSKSSFFSDYGIVDKPPVKNKVDTKTTDKKEY